MTSQDGPPAAPGVDRRLVLAAPAALLVGCAKPWPPLPPGGPGATRIVDAHTHLFNASDLPIHRFVEHVILRPVISLGAAQALVDLVLTVVKPLSMTVEAELEALKTGAPPETPPEAIAQAAGNRSLGLPAFADVPDARILEAAPEAEGDPRVQTNYAQLIEALALVYEEDESVLDNLRALEASEAPDARVRTRSLNRQVFLNAARAAGQPAQDTDAAAERAAGRMSRRGPSAAFEIEGVDPQKALAMIARTFSWAVILLQPRSQHLLRYLRTYNGDTARPGVVVNFLVDFGRWLEDDGPAPKSSIPAQIGFWKAAADHYGRQTGADLRLLTFAPYCPLQHAYDRRAKGAASDYLPAFLQAFRDSAIAGLKLYPPMGFYPLGNADHADADYVGEDGVRTKIVDAWNRGGAPMPLGKALDAALRQAYAACEAGKIPIAAHAGPSNTPARNFEDRPDPANWAAVAREFPALHILLGHFASDAGDFVKAMNGQPTETPAWPVTSTAKVLREHPNVFVDLSYIEEILGDAALEAAFFEQLRRYALEGSGSQPPVDPDLSQIVYGSDWIMLQRERGQGRYLELMRRRIAAAPWPADAFQRIFVDNGRRFLFLDGR